MFTIAPVDSPADVNRDGVINYDDLFDPNAWWDNVFGSPPLAPITPPAPPPLLESIDSVFSDDLSWAAELVWFDELYGTSNDSEEEDILEETAVDGDFTMYSEE